MFLGYTFFFEMIFFSEIKHIYEEVKKHDIFLNFSC